MIRFKLREVMENCGRRVTVQEVADATGIHRATLSRILNENGYNAETDTIEALCRYFNCRVEDVMEFVPDSGKRSAKANR